MTIDYKDALDVRWRIFPLNPIEYGEGGARCACGNPECKAIGKHPKNSSWLYTPELDASQLAYLEDEDGVFFGNQLLDNYGIVLFSSRLLVVDVDGRNDGFKSAERLADVRAACGFIVRTGSQSGEHWYFNLPDGYDAKKLRTKLSDFPGIDFKSSGFVVGPYSLHVSGYRYEALEGSPADVVVAPDSLLALLERPPFVASQGAGVDDAQLAEMVDAIPNDASTTYSEWVEVGMAIHHATGGAQDGLDLWSAWSRRSNPAESDELLSSKWHSFGKSANPVTGATIHAKAVAAGYVVPVTFFDDTDWGPVDVPKDESKGEAAEPKIDLLNPPGIVGELVAWINSRCALPREKLAVAGALQIISNTAGMCFLVEGRNTSLNLITFAIAGSRTGKGAIKRCLDEVSQATGISPATHGKFKSSQELVRNALQHQLVAYVYDEFGKQLEKVSGATSGAHYLEDLLAELMAMYSEATGMHGLSGDAKREMAEMQDKAIAKEVRRLGLSSGENPRDVAMRDPSSRLAEAYRIRDDAERGIIEPYLTFFGMSEPGSFAAAIEKDPWLLTGGFLGRALIFEEEETVPIEKSACDYNNDKISGSLLNRILCLSSSGSVSSGERVARDGDWRFIKYSKGGEAFFGSIRQYWQDVAIFERDSGSGLESQALGATELAIKVAGILAIETGTITEVEAAWAHELVKSVTLAKIERAKSNDALSSNAPAVKGGGLLDAILRHMAQLDPGGYTTAGRARQAAGRKKVSLEDAAAALSYLASKGKIREDVKTGKNGKSSFRYFAN